MTEPHKEFPAQFTVHWVNGPVHVCESHAQQMRGLASMMGWHQAITGAPDGAECANCKNVPLTATPQGST